MEGEDVTEEVLAWDPRWLTNAHMIADVARLGYLDGLVFDATYGKFGGFWRRWRPDALVTNDLVHPAAHAWDYRSVPLPDCSFDSVVFDPDYKLSGTPASGETDVRYGTNRRKRRDDILDDLAAGAIECYRLTRRWLLVKCMDQVEAGKMRWQTDVVTQAIDGEGGRKADRFDITVNSRPQPPDRTQRTARHRNSTLLVFEKPKRACQ